MLPFEFTVEGPPVSQQTRHKENLHAWRKTVCDEAGRRWPIESSPVELPICVEITHFYEGAPADVDNIAKPILDSLKGVLYMDDEQVTDLICCRRPLAGPYKIDSLSSPLADAIKEDREFLHIRITSASTEGELIFR